MKHRIEIAKEYDSDDLVDLLATAMCGCSYWCSELDYDDNEYKEARAKLIKNGNNEPCYEDILVEMLESGKSLYWVDCEDNTSNELTLEKLLNGIRLNAENRPHDCDLESGDAETMDCIIQYALFDDVIFG